jgi:serine/threonine protein kinase/tetratricopeptide (TPR) repeat protein
MLGKSILHYKIMEELGRGGMGVVYKAEDTKLKRNVAIKFLPKHISADSEERERFKIEAQSAAALSHPNIATIHAIEESADEMFIVMEYIDGKELKDHIDAGPLTVDDSLDIATQIGKGLQAAHQNGIVHRDIKSANIMLKADGQVKIMDFGLAKVRGGKQITKAGTTLGTAAYMSPEQTSGETVDHRSDIWSLGVLLYEMLTGQLPFKGDYDQAITYSILNEEQEPITGLRTGIPMEMERIVNKCLQKNPSDRYQHVDEFIVDLRQIKKESETNKLLSQTGTKRTLPQKQKRSFVVQGIIAVVIVLLIAGYFLFTGGTEIKERVPVAVADFVNETNEPELNSLSGMLITALEKSRRLSVLSRSHMFDILKQMGKENVEYIDESTGREICKEASINLLVVSSIRKFGKLYSIDLKILDAKSGSFIYTDKEDGEGQESIPGMLDRLAEKTRKGLKEKETEISSNSQKLAEVTTRNLEAYQYYFKGEELINKLKFVDAAEEFRKAVAIDPEFALAYYRLSYALHWRFEGNQALENPPLEKAMSMIDRIPEKEQYLLRAFKAHLGHSREDLQNGLSILKEMEKIYPNDKEMLYDIGDWSFHLGDYQAAEQYLGRVLKMDPVFERALQHLAWTFRETGKYERMLETAKTYLSVDGSDDAYSLLGEAYALTKQYDEGLQVLRQAQDLFPKNYQSTIEIAHLYVYQEQYPAAEKELQKLTAPGHSQETKQEGYRTLSNIYLYSGKFRDAIQTTDKVIEFEWQQKDTASASRWMIRKALLKIMGKNDGSGALREVEKTIPYQKHITSNFYWRDLAYLYVLVGKTELAGSIARQHEPLDRLILPVIDCEEGNCDKADSLNQTSEEGRNWTGMLYHLGKCYVESGQLEKGAALLHQMQSTTIPSWGPPFFGMWYPHGFYLLGKGYESSGKRDLAIKNYEKFLALWKDADNDLPDLIDAKNRLSKLKGAL